MLCVEKVNILYKLQFKRTFIENLFFYSTKNQKKCRCIHMSETIKIDSFGFREYDARWLYPKNINGAGIREVGKAFDSKLIKNKRLNYVILFFVLFLGFNAYKNIPIEMFPETELGKILITGV